MAINQINCYAVDCDKCDEAWEEGTPHWPTEAEAIGHARAWGFVIVGASVLCRDCATGADCGLTGHQFGDWHAGAAPGLIPHRTRICSHCLVTDYDPPFQELLLFHHAECDLERSETTPKETP